MKILLITGSLNQGGAEYQLLSLARLFNNKRLENEVLAITDYDHYLAFVKKHDIKYSFVSNDGSNISRLIRAVRLILSKKPDIVISFIKRVSQVAIVARIFSLFHFKLIISERTSRVCWWRDLYYFNLALLSNRITVNSISKYNYINRWFPLLKSRTIFIPNLLDLDRFLQIDRKSSINSLTKISYIGRISPEKNLLNLIKAVKQVTDNGYQVNLQLFGEANNFNYLKEVQQLITNCRAELFIKYCGPVQDVTEVYAETDLLCLVSFYEGFSNVLAEALASGVPIVASDIKENSYLIKNELNGFLVNPENPLSIAKGIEKFLECDKDKKMIISSKNRAQAKELFNDDKVFERYQSLINSLCNGKE